MAQTAGVMNGSLMRLYLDLAGTTTYTVMGNSMDATLNYSHSPRETTNQGSSGHATFLEGKRSATIDFNNLQAEDGANSFWLQLAVMISNTLRARVTGRLTSGVTGDKAGTFTGYLTALSCSTGGPENNVTMSGSIQLDGPITISTL